MAIGIGIDGTVEDSTPKHLVQHVLALQDTVQTVMHRRKRVSDVMRPPSAATVRRTAKHRSSGTALDLTAVMEKTTPRTAVLNILEQAQEAMPLTRDMAQPSNTSSSTAQNASYFTLNEVAISPLLGLECCSDSSPSRRGIMAKKRTLNIQLPRVSLTRLPESTTPKLKKKKSLPVDSPSVEHLAVRKETDRLAANSDVSATDVTASITTSPSTALEHRDTGFQEAFVASIAIVQTQLVTKADEKEEQGNGDSSQKANNSGRKRATLKLPPDDSKGEYIDAEEDGVNKSQNTQSHTGRRIATQTVTSTAAVQNENTDNEDCDKREHSVKMSKRKDASTTVGKDWSGSSRNIFSDVFLGAWETCVDEEAEGPRAITPLNRGTCSESTVWSTSAVSRSSSKGDRTLPQVDKTLPRDSLRKRKSISTTGQQSPHKAGAETNADEVAREPAQSRDMSTNMEDDLSSSKPAKRARKFATPILRGSPRTEGNTSEIPSFSNLSSSTALRSRRADGSSSAMRAPVERRSNLNSSSANKSRRAGSGSPAGRFSSKRGSSTPVTGGKRPGGIPESASISTGSPWQKEVDMSDDEEELSESPLPEESTEAGFPVSSTTRPDAQPPQPSLTPRSPRGHTKGAPASVSSIRQGHSPHMAPRDDGDSSGNLKSKSLVAGSSSRFGNIDSIYEMERSNGEKQPAQKRESRAFTGVFANPDSAASYTKMPQLPLDDSDYDDSSDADPEYSPLKTPRLPSKVSTPSTSYARLTGKKVIPPAVKPGRRAPLARKQIKKPSKSMPTRVVKAIFSHFSKLRVSKEAIAEVEKVSEQYWRNLAEDLEAYALHAHRQVINESDFELLMRRQGFVTDTCSLNTLIAKYLPLELRQELIPIARSGNVLEPKT